MRRKNEGAGVDVNETERRKVIWLKPPGANSGGSFTKSSTTGGCEEKLWRTGTWCRLIVELGGETEAVARRLVIRL
jgi:hypothetical protein